MMQISLSPSLSSAPKSVDVPMGTKALPVSVTQRAPEWLLGDNPGAAISGAPGSGKSNATEILLREVVRSQLEPGLLFIDPHGTSALKFYHWCLHQGPSVARRVLYLHFADTRKIPSIDVLHIPNPDVGSIAWYAQVAFVTELVSKILLAAWGETDFNSKPILFKNTFRVNYTLAHAGLPLAAAKMFAAVNDPLYSTLCQAVPDVLAFARNEMEELPELRPADQIAQLESWKNRVFGLFSNAYVEAVLSRTAADGALTMQQLYDDRTIVIVNLEQGGILRQMDQEILANVLLTMAIFTAMSTPADRRHLQVLAIDELPVFRSSADLLTQVALPQCRKYLLRTLACFCGATVFPDGTEDRLLQAFISLAGARLFFRHNSELDCSFIGRQVAMPTYSPLKVKYAHEQPMQFQEGHQLVELIDVSDTSSEGDSEGESQATGTTKTDTWNNTATTTRTDSRGKTKDEQLLRESVNEARAQAMARQSGQGGASGTSQENTVSRSRTHSRAHGVTRKQQLVPIIKTRNITTSVTFFTKEELEASAAALTANLRIGQAILHVSGAAPVQVTFPHAADPYTHTPKFGKKKKDEHQSALYQRPEFATIDQIHEQRDALLAALLQRLGTIARERAALPIAATLSNANQLNVRSNENSPLAI